MAKIIKRVLIGVGCFLALLIAIVVISAKVNNRGVIAQTARFHAAINWLLIKKGIINNCTLRIKYSGVLDEDGNVAASGTSIPITALEVNGHDLGIVGTISNGNLNIVLPPVPDSFLKDSEDDTKNGSTLFIEIDLVNQDGDYVHMYYVNKPTFWDKDLLIKGWNFETKELRYFSKVQRLYDKGYKWVLTE